MPFDGRRGRGQNGPGRLERAGQLIIVAATTRSAPSLTSPNPSAPRMSSSRARSRQGRPGRHRRPAAAEPDRRRQDHHGDQQQAPKQRENDLARQSTHVEVECRRASSPAAAPERRRRAPPAANASRAKLPLCVDHLSCVDHLCVTTVAVGGDAFARHLAEHTASAPGDPVTEAHKITKVRYVPGARSSDGTPH
jgi:hypothetical protein